MWVVETGSSSWHAKLSQNAAVIMTQNIPNMRIAASQSQAAISKKAPIPSVCFLLGCHTETVRRVRIPSLTWSASEGRRFGDVAPDGVRHRGTEKGGTEKLAYSRYDHGLKDRQGFRSHGGAETVGNVVGTCTTKNLSRCSNDISVRTFTVPWKEQVPSEAREWYARHVAHRFRTRRQTPRRLRDRTPEDKVSLLHHCNNTLRPYWTIEGKGNRPG